MIKSGSNQSSTNVFRVPNSLLLLLLFVLTNQAAFSTASTTRSHTNKSPPDSHHNQFNHSNKPTTTILPIKHLNFHQSPHHGHDTGNSGDESKNEFDRLNKKNKFGGGPITRDSVHEAVVRATRQDPSYDIVVMGVTSWN